jgi:hypothetical protein
MRSIRSEQPRLLYDPENLAVFTFQHAKKETRGVSGAAD